MKVRTARRSNQSILKETSPEYSLEGLMLKLKLQYFGYLMQRTDSLEKTLMLGKTEGGRRMRWLVGITGMMDMSLSTSSNSESWWWTGKPWRATVHGVAKSQTRLSDWTELKAPGVSEILLPFVKLSQCSFFNALHIYWQPSPKTKVLIAKGNR